MHFSTLLTGAVTAAAVFAHPHASQSNGVEAPVGTFQPPATGALRSSCPCMNTLSNHGYLRRDGGNNTRASIKSAFVNVLNIGEDVGEFFLNAAFGFGMGEGQNETLRLSAINGHDLIEHDVSLVRNDQFFHNDIFSINQTLVQKLLSFSSDGKTISIADLGRFRKDRFDESKATNPQLTFGRAQEIGAFGEGALLLATFGTKMPINQVESFLGAERLADDFVKRKDTIHLPGLFFLVARLKWAAGIFNS